MLLHKKVIEFFSRPKVICIRQFIEETEKSSGNWLRLCHFAELKQPNFVWAHLQMKQKNQFALALHSLKYNAIPSNENNDHNDLINLHLRWWDLLTHTKNYRQIYFSGFARKLLDQLRDKTVALMEKERKKRNKRQNFDH